MKTNKATILAVMGLLCLLMLLPGMYAATQDTDPPDEAIPTERLFHDRGAEIDVYTELNRWRMRRGRSPLQRNPQLDALALQQAWYVTQWLPFTESEVDFHTDEWDDGVVRRAELSGWEAYGVSGAVFVAEIAAYYPNVAGVIGFWRGSDIHRASALNRGYREVGIGVIRNGNWILAYAVLGSRPNVLPVTYMPATNTLILTRDQSGFSDALAFVPVRVQILNAYGERLHEDEWLVWEERIPLPAGATELLTVILSDRLTEIPVTVDLNAVNVLPADVVPTRTPTVTPFPTRTPPPVTPTIAPPTPTPSMTPRPRAPIDGYDILLLYNNVALTFINQSDERLDVTPLVFSAQQTNTTITGRWLGFYAEVPLTAFPPNFCMQAWSFFLNPERPPLPDDCELLASGRSLLLPGDRFWLAVEFEVRYDGMLIATCYGQDGQCAFDLPR